jgi:hypothetical protein
VFPADNLLEEAAGVAANDNVRWFALIDHGGS